MTWAPLWAKEESRPASRASRSGSTMVRGIMYSSLEWSKCPLTFTGLYSRSLSSMGLHGRGQVQLKPVWEEEKPSGLQTTKPTAAQVTGRWECPLQGS